MNLSQITHIAIMAVCAVVVSGAVHADNTCTTSGAVSINVDYEVTPDDGYDHNVTDETWTVHFPYGDVSGISQCSTTDGGTYTTKSTIAVNSAGTYCWGKMLSPAESQWVSFGYYPSSECVEACNDEFPTDLEENIEMREAVFGSVGN